MMNLVLFASGSGSNAENVVKYFKQHPSVKISALFCNNAKAGVIAKMDALEVPVVVFNKALFEDSAQFLSHVSSYKPDYIILLGFLWKIPVYLVKAYAGKIINLHPALLPKYGGSGMYGRHVHHAVKQSGDTETGITLHRVNEHYDEGEVIAQFKCLVEPTDTIEIIAEKIHLLEQEHVPAVIKSLSFPFI
ncbi:MAG: phosphoribosylglycinamide formyltransferase [Bacteroidia bacterium]|nr:phosphoribosylglycinamide formyltransferase [Bacteroidia bacterium]